MRTARGGDLAPPCSRFHTGVAGLSAMSSPTAALVRSAAAAAACHLSQLSIANVFCHGNPSRENKWILHQLMRAERMHYGAKSFAHLRLYNLDDLGAEF